MVSEQRRDHGLRLLDIEHDDAADHTGAICVWPGTCRVTDDPPPTRPALYRHGLVRDATGSANFDICASKPQQSPASDPANSSIGCHELAWMLASCWS